LPKRDARDLARLLLAKAAGDEGALRALLPHHDIPDGVLGFHAQQAVEKRLKAVLTLQGIDYPMTHNLGELARRLTAAGIDLPAPIEEIRILTPWGSAAANG
jgi:hypothetical protein